VSAETPAAVLRAAADKIRTLATATYIGGQEATAPWHVEECDSSEAGDCACIVAQGYHSYPGAPQTGVSYVADAETPEYAAFIAAMGPGVGVALAEVFEAWARMGRLDPDLLNRVGGAETIAAARAVLGEGAQQ
jgi:hypothetical protein